MKKWKTIFLSFCVLLLLAGCSSAEKEVEGNIYQIYYVNKEQTKVSCNEYVTAAEDTAVVLEELAFMAYHTEALNPNAKVMQQELLDKHYLRKHGKNAYYGQK